MSCIIPNRGGLRIQFWEAFKVTHDFSLFYDCFFLAISNESKLYLLFIRL